MKLSGKLIASLPQNELWALYHFCRTFQAWLTNMAAAPASGSRRVVIPRTFEPSWFSKPRKEEG